MRNALIAILLCGVAVAACNAQREAKVEADKNAQFTLGASDDAVNVDGKDDGGVNIKVDTDSGEVELKLPGGLEGKVKIPEGLDAGARFDLDGLGRYPGAKLISVNVQASGKDGDGRGLAVLGFSAPGTAGQVANWYEKALIQKGRKPSRNGNTLTGTTDDGDLMVIAVEDGETGVARGRISITDRKG